MWSSKAPEQPPPPAPEQAASSTAATTPTSPIPSPEAIPEPSPVVEPTPSFDLLPDTLTAESIRNLEEAIGYLNSLGLSYGYGFTSSIQWLMEHIHVWGGVPWWAAIAIAAVAARLVLYKPISVGLEHSTRMQILRRNPEYDAATKAWQRAAMAGTDQQTVMILRQKAKIMEQAAGIQTWKLFLGFLQIPVGIGFFRSLNGMARLPVPSMETQGVLWFQDLTVPDPYYILPIVGPIIMVIMLRVRWPFPIFLDTQTITNAAA